MLIVGLRVRAYMSPPRGADSANAAGGADGVDAVDTADAADDADVRWRGDADDRPRTAFRHVVASVFALLGLGVLAMFALVAGRAVTEGVTDAFVVLVVMLVVGGPFSLFYLVAIREEASLSELLPYDLDLNPRYVLLALPVGVALLAAWVRFPPVAVVYLVAGPLLWGFLAARDSTGELDVEAGTLTYDDGTVATDGPKARDVRTLRSHASWRVGGYRLVRLRYAGSLSLSKPSVVVVPDADYPAVDAALSAVERRAYDVDVTETSPVAKAVLAGFGLLFVALAAGIAAAAGGTDSRALMPALLLGCFGVGFAVLAWFA